MLLLLLPLATSRPAPAASGDLPAPWIRAGSAPMQYEMGVDASTAHSGKSSGHIRSISTNMTGFGTLMQTCIGSEYRGKRVRMSGWVKSQTVAGWAGMWMRVDGANANDMLGFDNMQSRAIRGTEPWRRYEIVLDVPQEAKDIAFGILLDGMGEVWIDDVRFEVVDSSVPTTGVNPHNKLPEQPGNLDFEG
jgi:hypothetical protein